MRSWIVASLAAVFIALAANAQAGQRYIVQASTWSAAQDAAVREAGGNVLRSHAPSGVGVVESSDPEFYSKISRDGNVAFVEKDIHLLYQQPALFERDIHLLDIHLLDIHLLDIHLLDIHLLDIHLLDIHLLDIHLLDIHLLDIHLLQNGTAQVPAGNPLYAYQWAPRAVNASAAWQRGYTGRGVRVAIVDGGISANHPALAPNIDRAASTSCVAGYGFDEDVGEYWHATHVAGIVAGAFGTGGTLGIAPEATLIGVKVAHDGEGSFSDLLCGIMHAATSGRADVINLSLGATIERTPANARLLNALAKVVNFATRNGAVVVAAAGNDGADLDRANVIEVPAESGAAIAVSATGPVGWAKGASDSTRFASYSNFGRKAIDIAAPGGDVAYAGDEECRVGGLTRPCWVFDMVLSTSPNGYSWRAGTSMAAPAASAVAALVKQRHPGASAAQVRAILERSAVDAGARGDDAHYGSGIVDAGRATQ
jgi:subtilisin family serine protease